MRDVIKGPGISIELDTREIYPNDPGMGTPVIVSLENGETATWNVATIEGETVDGTKLTDEQKEWLKDMESDVEEWMEANGV